MSCSTGKHGYVTEELAEHALYFAKTFNNKRKPVRYYACPECGRYHLTSQELKDYAKEYNRTD